MGKYHRNKPTLKGHIPTAPSFKLSPAICKQGYALLDQQMWCWGCDVRRKSGNLLVAYGFEQRLSPEPRWHSAYTVCLNPDCALTLWGWGLWLAAQDYGSLFLSRSGFRVRHTPEVVQYPQAWQVDDLPSAKIPCDPVGQRNTRHLLADALRWVGEYEHWLATRIGPEYREQVTAAWPQRRRYHGGIPAAYLADTWLTLSKAVREEYPN